MRHRRLTKTITSSVGLSLLLIAFCNSSLFLFAEALDMGENQLSIDRSVDIDALIPSRHRADRSYFHYPQLNSSKIQLVPELSERERWLRQSPALSRILDEGNNNNNNENVNDDAAAAAIDDAAVADDVYDDATANDDYQNQIKYICEDKTCTVNEQCTKFLFGFLEGTTDAKDNC